jgi:hypothetical protein
MSDHQLKFKGPWLRFRCQRMDGDTRCHRDCSVGGCAVVLALGEEVRAALRELHERSAVVHFQPAK